MTEITIKATKDGPNIVFVDGKVLAALCRCGASAQKPYCDGSHKRIGFTAASQEIKWPKENTQVGFNGNF